MAFKITRITLQKIYPNLANLEDIAEKICFASGAQISPNIGINPIFGATFYFYITQNAMTLNYQELQAVIDIIFNSQLLDLEIQSMAPLLTILKDIITLIAKTQTSQTEAEKIQNSDQAKSAIMSLDSSFFQQDGFSQGTFLASSLVLMAKLFLNPHFSQQASLYSTLLMGNVSQINQCQFELICQLLNISCTVYQEIGKSTLITPIFSFTASDSPLAHALILSEDGNSMRFAFNTTLKNKEDFIINELFLVNQETQIEDILHKSLLIPDAQSQLLLTEIDKLMNKSNLINQENEQYKKLIQKTIDESLNCQNFYENCLREKQEYSKNIQDLKIQLNKM